MGIFIEATTEPFTELRQSVAETERESSTRTGPAGAAGVRRPVRGYQLKENSYATLRIIGPNSQFFQVIDAAGETYVSEEGIRKTRRYSNFFVHQVQESRSEKQQVVDTFGDPIIFLFGQAPRSVTVQGTLLNTADFNWRNEFWYNYDRYFRGTRLAEMNARLYLIYDDRIIEGLMLQAQAQETAKSRESIQFTFQMFVTGVAPISIVGDPQFPRPNNTSIDFTQQDSYERGLRAWDDARRISEDTIGQKLLEANKDAYIAQTLIGTITDMMSGGFVNAGTPDLSAFISRATVAAAGTAAVLGDVESMSGGPTAPTRTIPIRESIVDNVDEFIGGVPQPTQEGVAARNSQTNSWQAADTSIDQTIISAVNTTASQATNFVPTDPAFYDLMGRAGRADQEIASEGGSRRRLTDRPNTIRQTRQGELLRTVPFGLIATSGELPEAS